ncbi:lymphocyte antigen 6E-like [Ascaphus truei]|uniref:lymphocyte antigen 6E-like n=1 Tax=Ascaphus truei TaxID=8439 RepID=UPI003F5A12E8
MRGAAVCTLHLLTMATWQAILLVTALCIGTGYSLSCYTCTSQSSNANCMTATNCTASDTSCMTSVVGAGVAGVSFSSITKTCTSSCTPSNFGFSVASTSVTCCSTDLCNISGATSVKTSYAALALSMGLILALLKNPAL